MAIESGNDNNDGKTPKLVKIDGGIDFSQPLNPYVKKQRRHFDCSFLKHPVFSEKTAHALAHAIALRMASLSRPADGQNLCAYKSLPKFFVWLTTHLDSDSAPPYIERVRHSFGTDTKPNKEDWQRVVNDFRCEMQRPPAENFFTSSESNVTRNICHLNPVRALMKICVLRGILPVSTLRGFKIICLSTSLQ